MVKTRGLGLVCSFGCNGSFAFVELRGPNHIGKARLALSVLVCRFTTYVGPLCEARDSRAAALSTEAWKHACLAALHFLSGLTRVFAFVPVGQQLSMESPPSAMPTPSLVRCVALFNACVDCFLVFFCTQSSVPALEMTKTIPNQGISTEPARVPPAQGSSGSDAQTPVAKQSNDLPQVPCLLFFCAKNILIFIIV